jgi:hypothetical protein
MLRRACGYKLANDGHDTRAQISGRGTRVDAFMNTIDIYCQAIKRTFAGLYGVAPDKVDVSWSDAGDNITVRCADKTFTHETLHDDDEPTLEFVGDSAVTVRLTTAERLRLEGIDGLNGF